MSNFVIPDRIKLTDPINVEPYHDTLKGTWDSGLTSDLTLPGTVMNRIQAAGLTIYGQEKDKFDQYDRGELIRKLPVFWSLYELPGNNSTRLLALAMMSPSIIELHRLWYNGPHCVEQVNNYSQQSYTEHHLIARTIARHHLGRQYSEEVPLRGLYNFDPLGVQLSPYYDHHKRSLTALVFQVSTPDYSI